MALNSRSRFVSLVIHDMKDKKLDGVALQRVIDWLDINTDFYAYIYHDMDTKLVNKQIVQKPPHTHFIFLLKPNEIKKSTTDEKKQKQYKRFSTIMNELSDVCGFDTMYFTISVADDWIGNCRYLLHLDSRDKFPYSKDLVHTNNQEMYDNFIASPSKKMTADNIYTLLEDCDYSLYLVIQNLGIDGYKKYRLVIQDICKSMFKTLER